MQWPVLGPDLDTVLGACADPLHALASGEIGGVLLKNVYRPIDCETLVERFVAADLIPDPSDPDSILTGEYQAVAHYRADDSTRRPLRIDIGSSLVNHTRLNPDSSDKESNKARFLDHSDETRALFRSLFDGLDNPVERLYGALASLSRDKHVRTAYEPNGREYGPAIFRVHYPGQTYTPHINHVRTGDRLTEFNVARYEHQFAGLICLQHSADVETTPHAKVYRCEWTPEVRRQISAGSLDGYVQENDIATCTIAVEPGDFYLFNSGLIHEVGAVVGANARIVLATFIGYSEQDDEVMVWA